MLDDDHYAASYWYHVKCFHFKPRHKIIDANKMNHQIYGIEDLDPEDCDKIVDYLTE